MFSDSSQTLLFQKKLESSIGNRLKLKFNNNRSTMLSVKWEPNYTKVSLHHMFLGAPQNVMQDLACYLKGKQKKIAPAIKAYIEHNLQKFDYSHELNLAKLQTQGKVYNLNSFYEQLNEDYFNSSLNLSITWFGKGNKSCCNRVTFGLFYDPLRLIKINRLLDNKIFPHFFLSYVIYHEMLHYLYPPYVDEKGVSHIHNKAFKEKERKFKYYQEAQEWIRHHHRYLFNISY